MTILWSLAFCASVVVTIIFGKFLNIFGKVGILCSFLMSQVFTKIELRFRSYEFLKFRTQIE